VTSTRLDAGSADRFFQRVGATGAGHWTMSPVGLDLRPVTTRAPAPTFESMNDDRYGVLLVRKVGHMLDSTFGYRADRLPDVNDVIDVIDAVGNSVRAQVNGIEKAKSLPIRAAEL
jgi:hypothetical protein